MTIDEAYAEADKILNTSGWNGYLLIQVVRSGDKFEASISGMGRNISAKTSKAYPTASEALEAVIRVCRKMADITD